MTIARIAVIGVCCVLFASVAFAEEPVTQAPVNPVVCSYDLLDALGKGRTEEIREAFSKRGGERFVDASPGKPELDGTFMHFVVRSATKEEWDLITPFVKDEAAYQAVDRNKGTLLHLLAMYNKDKSAVDIARFLVEEKKLDVNAKDSGGHTPLFYSPSVDMAKYFISTGADVNAVDNNGYTPLMAAMAACSQLDHGSIDTEKERAEVSAQNNEWHQKALYLLANGADALVWDKKHLKTALHCAVEQDQGEMVPKLVKAMWTQGLERRLPECVESQWANLPSHTPIDIHTNRPLEGHTLIFMAAERGAASAVRALISCGARVNTRNVSGFTPIFYARSGKVAEALIAAGAEVNCVPEERSGYTPLHHLAWLNQGEAVEVLLKNGADPYVLANGLTPYQWALDKAGGKNNAKSVAAFRRCKADIVNPNKLF